MISSNTEEDIKPEHVSLFSRNIVDINEFSSEILKGDYNHGRCGGYNLGNTCFMNSSIACLSNCTELTTYFLTEKFKQDINKKNKEGLGGKLANAWYELLQEYWLSNKRIGNPSNVKSTVAKKVRKFSGFNQQDSNEFMTEFLSILSEDLNKANKKDYKEIKEKQDNENDLQCASRFWKMHFERNDSIITDLFSGLLKSTVNCSNCGYNNITFDPFNTLTLAIPDSIKYFIKVKKLYDDIEFFYIPKYCIKNNLRIRLRVKKDCPLKEIKEELKNLKSYNYNINKLKFIQVSDGKLIRFIDDNESKKENDFVFGFDDESKDGENNKIIPLYMKKVRNSSFPRLLFLDENMNFGDLKRKIYYFARNYFNNLFNNEEKTDDSELDKEIKKYKEIKKDEAYDENKLFELFIKEYEEIFNIDEKNNKKEEIENFLNDFPYEINIKKKFDDENDLILFDGKNNFDNLKEFNISKDEDLITTLLSKLEGNECYYLFLVLKQDSKYIIKSAKLDSCETFEGPNFGKKDKLNLDNLLEFFCSDENLEKGNEWYCNNCKKKVTVTKKFSIFFVPRILIICLNRFSREGSYYEKNGEFIDFPVNDLDMGKYVSGPDKAYSKYDLFAVSQHFGGTGGGHYTAVCKNIDGNWYDYNDSSCSKISANEVVTPSAYVLFYRKKNW